MQAGGVLPLPQSGCQHAEGTGPALETGAALDGFKKAQAHTALADIHESIDELLAASARRALSSRACG
jgi:hypothetical protein